MALPPECYIFGYGSLLNPDSINRTAKHPIPLQRLQPAWLEGYFRSWTIVGRVLLENYGSGTTPMVFLNIEPDPEQRCNGILFPIREDFIEPYDRRERHYERVDVSHLVTPRQDAPVYTYVGMTEHLLPPGNPEDAIVGSRYEETVEEGLVYWGNRFREDYEKTTRPHTLKSVPGVFAAARD